jgi:lipid II:glycine glycyltransferase (peptidoglycan interpeptide bridge formation enzyme)
MVMWSIFDGDEKTWDDKVCQFDSFTIYQSYSWGEAKRKLGWRVYRLVALGHDGEALGLFQVLVKRRSSLVAVCWIPGGIVGELSFTDGELRDNLLHITGVRWVYIRMNMTRLYSANNMDILESNGWRKPAVPLTTPLSLELNLTLRGDELLTKASKNWRHNLRRAARSYLRIERWLDPQPEEISNVYRQMEQYKRISLGNSYDEIAATLECLGPRIIIFRCFDEDGDLIALRGCAVMGNRAYDLYAAATAKARKVYATYTLLWEVLEECRKNGILSYDLSGIDPHRNRGVYNFKKGSGAHPIEYLGEWETSNCSFLPKLVNAILSVKRALYERF